MSNHQRIQRRERSKISYSTVIARPQLFSINFDRRIDLSMKNSVVQLIVNDLTVLLVDGICMKNSTKEDNVRRVQ